MEGKCACIKITETDEGYRIDVTGKEFKEMFACCFQPTKAEKDSKSGCCAEGEKE